MLLNHPEAGGQFQPGLPAPKDASLLVSTSGPLPGAVMEEDPQVVDGEGRPQRVYHHHFEIVSETTPKFTEYEETSDSGPAPLRNLSGAGRGRKSGKRTRSAVCLICATVDSCVSANVCVCAGSEFSCEPLCPCLAGPGARAGGWVGGGALARRSERALGRSN